MTIIVNPNYKPQKGDFLVFNGENYCFKQYMAWVNYLKASFPYPKMPFPDPDKTNSVVVGLDLKGLVFFENYGPAATFDVPHGFHQVSKKVVFVESDVVLKTQESIENSVFTKVKEIALQPCIGMSYTDLLDFLKSGGTVIEIFSDDTVSEDYTLTGQEYYLSYSQDLDKKGKFPVIFKQNSNKTRPFLPQEIDLSVLYQCSTKTHYGYKGHPISHPYIDLRESLDYCYIVDVISFRPRLVSFSEVTHIEFSASAGLIHITEESCLEMIAAIKDTQGL